MNIFSIIEELEKVDPELNDRFSPRRAAIKNITSFGSKVAVAALPFAFATLFKRAYGQAVGDIGNVNGVLNFALKLEYLEAAFYTQGVATTNLIAAADLASITVIRDHEKAHVALLQGALGAAAVPQSGQGVNGVYDFTTSFPTVFTNYDTFLAVANALEDTGVRAYKGQAPNLIGNPVLTTALNIHSVEARHAAHIRQIRQKRGGAAATLKPWISGSASVSNDTGIGAAVDGNYGAGVSGYPAENNTTQGGVNITTLAAVSGTTSITAAIEAFDEPLDYVSVFNLVKGFGVK
ncbi:ferritin-like protein [Mucilaginibacter gracilis]|uniref:Ferritin-like protein n=1 Tax=Mucilaginibacter gracilis TaxID=423350 RepID=A0A495IWE5_9SPHI|nr:ferritin-like domain-containing protein [Mucilaginibacter gracilis]RKR80328.1 ferritin-like protein [Mucilaginibacter gracilis]